MVKVRELTEADVVFSLEIEEDDIPVRGNFASGDDKADKELEDSIIKRLRNGDTWAWASVKVTATWKGWKGVDHLGACSYDDEADFKEPGGYYDDMKSEALADLNKSLSKCAEELTELEEA